LKNIFEYIGKYNLDKTKKIEVYNHGAIFQAGYLKTYYDAGSSDHGLPTHDQGHLWCPGYVPLDNEAQTTNVGPLRTVTDVVNNIFRQRDNAYLKRTLGFQARTQDVETTTNSVCGKCLDDVQRNLVTGVAEYDYEKYKEDIGLHMQLGGGSDELTDEDVAAYTTYGAMKVVYEEMLLWKETEWQIS